ncbi:MAG: hypothetical protein DMD61_03450 [Gemmatimonadetes bacterium]|nr:MAG: hypothetical protein DMD61_03450 [Gemmatimonadota bacterium]
MTDYRALLAVIAVPRLVGTAAHQRVRDRLKSELVGRGFVVMEHRFSGRSLLYRFGRTPLDGINLIAVRPRVRIRTWLTAHYDSKGQRLSMASRLLAAGLVTLGALELAGVALRGLLGMLHLGPADALLGLAGLVGAALLAANPVTDNSAGAVDNGSGVIAVLATVDALPPDAGVGVIFSDAEEYGLVGARAIVRERANLLADTAVLNFDGIDDRGGAVAFVHRPGPTVDAVTRATDARGWRRLPVLVDGIAFGAAARECVTIMRGDWSTTRIVHTSNDTAERLTLEGARQVGVGVARALQPA